MLTRFLASIVEPAYTALRIVSGFLFSCHGMQKMLGLFADPEHPMNQLPMQMKIGGCIELVGGLLMAFGLFTRCAAFVSSGTMAVAYIQFHWKGQFDQSFFPIVNHGEPAVIYAFLFLYIACRGPGRCAIDNLIKRRPQP